MAAQGKALTYLLTVLGGIAGALVGFIVTVLLPTACSPSPALETGRADGP